MEKAEDLRGADAPRPRVCRAAWTGSHRGPHTCLSREAQRLPARPRGASCWSHEGHRTFPPRLLSISGSKWSLIPGLQVTSHGRWPQRVTQTGLQTYITCLWTPASCPALSAGQNQPQGPPLTPRHSSRKAKQGPAWCRDAPGSHPWSPLSPDPGPRHRLNF